MSTASTFVPQSLIVTNNALAKVRELVEEEENPDLKLRVYVTGGGCSGFQYGFAFEEQHGDDDAVIDNEGICVVVDAMSYPYLVGATLDYEEGLQGSRFTVTNPNASSTCGCGSSFSI
ncbi:iron-sulfur cluster insertion protein ErpA [Agaribacterium haliotis]|uniref:iron-sulfur cluster insertion protein ErpA n=1 Tax=Agaribacterium haliotis TaxID=2013869 RepID=UPI000BB57727|nr:iron-sulfur cluster insertion protein ErpA [Agaribacterium haliotis]